jgi:hypothetical protein
VDSSREGEMVVTVVVVVMEVTIFLKSETGGGGGGAVGGARDIEGLGDEFSSFADADWISELSAGIGGTDVEQEEGGKE